MENGILGMVCGWLGSLQLRYPETEWVVTGGDASVLLPCLHWKISHQPDLVLEGLSLALP
jgi:pantothenate kinase type III